MNIFHGQAYLYPTPNDGIRQIGVCRVSFAGVWIVGWASVSGARHRIKTHHLPPGDEPDVLQEKLDTWASERGLKKA